MSVLIKGGTVVTAEQMFRADVYCENGKIKAVGGEPARAQRGQDRRCRRPIRDARRN